MSSPKEILETLDGFADRFEFPGFNNMNYETADSRLHCFRDGDRWALVIESLVDWPAADGLMTVVFAMGDIRDELLTTLLPIETPIEYDDDTEELVIPDEVVVRGKSVAVDREAIDATSEQHEVEGSFALILELVKSHRDALFCTAEELAERVAPGLALILTLDDWAHPDVYGGPKPSESPTFQQLADVLASGDVSRYAPTDSPNSRDWKMWLESR
jgi:hypothetical protein